MTLLRMGDFEFLIFKVEFYFSWCFYYVVVRQLYLLCFISVVQHLVTRFWKVQHNKDIIIITTSKKKGTQVFEVCYKTELPFLMFIMMDCN